MSNELEDELQTLRGHVDSICGMIGDAAKVSRILAERIAALEARVDNLDKNNAFLFTRWRELSSRSAALGHLLEQAGYIDAKEFERQTAIAETITDQMIAREGLLRFDDDEQADEQAEGPSP